MSKFADDTKLCHKARNPDDIMELQEDINKLVQLNIDSTWFASYLHDRTHSVKIDKITSEA